MKKLHSEKKIKNKELNKTDDNFFLKNLYEKSKSEISNKDQEFYIVEKGKLQMILDGDFYTLSKGNSISTKALVKTAKNFCHLSALKKTYLFRLELTDYTTIFNEFIDKFHEKKINYLKKNFLFAKEDSKTLKILSNRLVQKKYDVLTPLIMKGEYPSSLFFVVKGEIICMNENDKLYSITENNFVGSINFFLIDIASQYSFYATKNTTLYVIDHDTIENIIGFNSTNIDLTVIVFNNNPDFNDNGSKLLQHIFLNAVNNSQLFSKYFNNSNIHDFYKLFSLKLYENDGICGKKNKKLLLPIEGYFSEIISNFSQSIIKSSFVSSYSNIMNNVSNISENNSEVIHFFPNGNFYEEFLFKNPKAKSNCVVSKYSSLVLEASWNDVLQSIVSYLNKNLTLYDLIKFIKNVNYFDNFSEIKLFYIAENLRTIIFKEKELIIKNGPESDRLYLIKKGTVEMFINNIRINELTAQNYFGEIGNKKENNENNRKSMQQKPSYYAKTLLECYYIDKEVYDEIISLENSSSLNKNYLNYNIKLDKLYYLKELGEGAYGKVHLVHDKKELYALKTAEISAMVNDKKLVLGYLNEKYIMSILSHPFIVRLISTFKTGEFLLFLMEFVKGISLRDFIEKQEYSQLRNIKLIKFIAAILCVTLNYLQRRRIIHRDFKPDNLMIDSDGYVKTIDFGVAKNMSGKEYTLSLIGTHQYMSPELVSGQKYSFSVDVWACGVILYEVFYGKIPFGFGLKDSKDIYKEIKELKPVFPSDPKIEDANNFIKDLLEKNPVKRMNNFYKWKNYKLFLDYDLDKLYKKQLESPLFDYDFVVNNEKTNDVKINNPKNWNIGKTFVEFMKNNIFCSFQDMRLKPEGEYIDYLNDF